MSGEHNRAELLSYLNWGSFLLSVMIQIILFWELFLLGDFKSHDSIFAFLANSV